MSPNRADRRVHFGMDIEYGTGPKSTSAKPNAAQNVRPVTSVRLNCEARADVRRRFLGGRRALAEREHNSFADRCNSLPMIHDGGGSPWEEAFRQHRAFRLAVTKSG